MTEAKAVLDAQRYDVPGQGRLFVEPAPAMEKTQNGEENGSGEHKRARRGRRPS